MCFIGSSGTENTQLYNLYTVPQGTQLWLSVLSRHQHDQACDNINGSVGQPFGLNSQHSN